MKWNFEMKKLIFPSMISPVNVTKSAGNCGFGHIYWRNLWWKTLFFVQCSTQRDWMKCVPGVTYNEQRSNRISQLCTGQAIKTKNQNWIYCVSNREIISILVSTFVTNRWSLAYFTWNIVILRWKYWPHGHGFTDPMN